MEALASESARALVLELVAKASEVRLEPSVPLRRYYRTLNEMFRMGTVYEAEGALGPALTLFVRFTSMWLEAVPKHPAFASADGAAEKAKAKNHLLKAITEAERLKKQLRQNYYEEALTRLKKAAEADARDAERKAAEVKVLPTFPVAQQPRPSPTPTSPRPSTPTAPTPSDAPPPYSPSHMGPGLPIFSGLDYPDPDDLSPMSTQPPAPPPPSYTPSVPDRSTKPCFGGPAPPIERSLKKVAIGSGGPSYGGVDGLRSLLIPSSLVPKFAALAAPNTRQNVETCGILCGQLAANRLVVTCLMVPEQSGTSDSCTTSGEELLFEALDSRDLITLGWIHTHPSQTAFLSSVDLHTQAGYQLMLDEAVAVVYSPKFEETGVFQLSPDGGLKEIADCRKSGFHPHTQVPPCFRIAPHAVTTDGIGLEIVDLRARSSSSWS